MCIFNNVRTTATLLNSFSVNQYGYWVGCLTIDAAGKLKKLAASAIKKRQFGAAISLDIQNAFKSVPWTRIMDALVNAKVSVYIRRIISDYFQDWMVLPQTASSIIKKEMTYGVLQGSILGPAMEYRHWRHPEGGSPTGCKYHLLCRWYHRWYGRGQYSHARVEDEHQPWGYDPLNRVGSTSLTTTKMEVALFIHLHQFSPPFHLKGE